MMEETPLAAWVWMGWFLLNALSYCLFFWDKRAALRGDWRVSESTLLFVALIGGSLGAMIGRRVFRHKTRKQPFAGILKAIFGLHILLVLGLILWKAGLQEMLQPWLDQARTSLS